MQASTLFQDINSGCLTEVVGAAAAYDSVLYGSQVRQSFYIYPNDTIVCLNSMDSGYQVLTLSGDDEIIFRNLHKGYFN